MFSKVADLIDPQINSWDANLVHQTFNAEDSKIDLQIPIHDHFDDSIAWHFDKKGIFLVKSAYKVEVDNAERESSHGQTSTSRSSGEATDFEWKKIWALPLPNKVLHFIWHMEPHSLPLRMKLKTGNGY